MTSHLLPSDADWPEDKRLMADLSHLNTESTRYIFNLLDVDAGRAAPLSVADERDLGQKFIDLGARLQERANERQARDRRHAVQQRQADPPANTDP